MLGKVLFSRVSCVKYKLLNYVFIRPVDECQPRGNARVNTHITTRLSFRALVNLNPSNYPEISNFVSNQHNTYYNLQKLYYCILVMESERKEDTGENFNGTVAALILFINISQFPLCDKVLPGYLRYQDILDTRIS